MARQQGAKTAIAFAFESTYGTAPVSGYTQLPFITSSLSAGQPLLDDDILGLGRDPAAPIKDALTADGDHVIPIDTDGIGYWLKLVFGSPATSGTTPKTHTFQSGNWTLPSASIETQMPDVPSFPMYSGVMADRLSFSMTRSGLLQATVGLVAQGETLATATAAGALGQLATLTRFGHFNGAIRRDGATLANIVSAEVNYMNNLDRIETIRSDGKIDGLDPSKAMMNGNIVARFADTTLLTQAINGTPCSLEFAWSIGANASLTITAHAVYLPRPRREISGPSGMQVTFDWQAARATSPARMATAVLVNTVASY
jgi:hypothetical protein